MKKIIFILFLFLFCLSGRRGFCFPQGCIEVDLNSNKAKITNFYFGGCEVEGNFSFALSNEDGSLKFDLEGKNISFENKDFSELKMELVKIGDIIFINNLSLERLTLSDSEYLTRFTVKGSADLEKNQLSLDINGSWQEDSKALAGLMKLKLKMWGALDSLAATGSLVVEDGRYEGNEFSKLNIDFLGKPPLLNITGSEVTLKNGNVLEMAGVLDLRSSSKLIPNVEFIVQKAFIDDWQIFSKYDESVGLKKDIDDKLNVCLNTGKKENDLSEGPETELTYSWHNGKFLKLKKEDGKTIVGLEQRKDF
ncbi:MAG: hypothetical protein ABIH08_04160 [Candidatus Omnitrophota bacterium]